jgi:hypothetical protein
MRSTPYCYGCEGSAKFIRASIDALEGTLSLYFDDPAWLQDSELPTRVPQLTPNDRPRALGLLEVAGGFTLFVATCFGKKIFDEFYDRLLKRPLEPFINRLCKSVPLQEGKGVEIRDIIYLEDIDTTVIVRAVTTAENASETARLFLQAHRVAHSYLESHGRKAPVHCHTIAEGRVAIEPDLFLSVEHQAQATRRASRP